MISRAVIQDAVRSVVKYFDIDEAYLFGSFARGDEDASSDIDIRLLCGPGITISDLVLIQNALSERLGRSVDIVSADPHHLKPRFLNTIRRDEVKLYAA